MPPNNQTINTPPPAAPPPVHEIPRIAMLDADERVVTVVYRHVIGLIFIYLEAFSAIAALLILIILAFPDLFQNLSTNSNILVVAGAIFGMALIFFILFLATYIYRQSKLIVTDKNLVQIMPKGLFVRKVSRLSISNGVDVSADQKGLLPTIFYYGTLTVKPAGELENFLLP